MSIKDVLRSCVSIRESALLCSILLYFSNHITYLSHVGNIKQRRLAFTTAPQVLLHHTAILSLVKNGKLVASKWYHVSTKFLVQLIQCCLDEIATVLGRSSKCSSRDSHNWRAFLAVANGATGSGRKICHAWSSRFCRRFGVYAKVVYLLI